MIQIDLYTKKGMIFIPCIWIAILLVSCKKLVEVDPPVNQLVSATVYKNNGTAAAAVTSIYTRMIGSSVGFTQGEVSINFLTGLYSDELKNYSANLVHTTFNDNNLLPTTDNVLYTWQELYQYIYSTNAIIEGLNKSTGVDNGLKDQLIGEAKFLRAFFHFYLTSLWGDVPLVTSTDYLTNKSIVRTPTEQVYQQIINDLKDAQSLLSDDYRSPIQITNEKLRPNKSAAIALLARVYLYNSKWTEAETQASAVINNNRYSLRSDLNEVFLKNSTEAIWQLSPVDGANFTWEANRFILRSAPDFITPAAITNSLLNSFESGDVRKSKWVGSITDGGVTYYFPWKYKARNNALPLGEYLMVLRLAEQYLIRAEARAQLNNLTGAIADINIIRGRTNLPALASNLTQGQVLTAIEQERRSELFCEWGHRWFDLKRWNRAEAVLAALKGSIWQTTDKLFPIPQWDILKNPNITQNPGY